jgi:hypothetical protein
MHIRTKELPITLQDALRTLGYHKTDIEVEALETVSPHDAGGQGRRGFFAAVELSTGEINVTRGSWGGANMFNPRNRVDLDQGEYPIPENTAAIQGSGGYGGTWATVYVRPTSLAGLLPEPASLTEEERQALYCHISIKGGTYRRDELRTRGVTERTLLDLVEKGLLKQNKAGARSVTTEGKNALETAPGKRIW